MRFPIAALLVVASAWPSALWAQQRPTPSTTPSPKEHTAAPRDYQPAQYARGQDHLLQDLQHAVRYPVAALRAHISGTVRVAFTVEPTGAVDDIRIVSSPSPLLNEGVVQAVKLLAPFCRPGARGSWCAIRSRVRWSFIFCPPR